MSYCFSQGLRLVVPYLDKFQARVKAAWVGKELRQVCGVDQSLLHHR